MDGNLRMSWPCSEVYQLRHSYQLFEPTVVRRACHFTPSCSDHALRPLRMDGLWMGAPRIVCRPWRCRFP